MGRLIFNATGCKYKARDGQLKEQFINGLNDDNMIAEIMKRTNSHK